MSRRLAQRRIAAAILALPLALTSLTACGEEENPIAAELNESSSSPSVEIESPEPAAETEATGEEIDPAEFVQRVRTGMESSTTAHLEMTSQGSTAGLTASGDVDYSTTPPSMNLTMAGAMAGGQILMIMVDGVMYMKMDELTNGKFIKMDLEEAAASTGQDLTSEMDIGESFAAMEDAIETVTFVGTEDVDGDELSHFTVLLDPDLMNAAKSGKGNKMGMPKQVSYEVWLDSDDRFRKTFMDMGKKLGSITMTLSDWGQDVEIKAPPADQVTEMPEMPTMPAKPSSGTKG